MDSLMHHFFQREYKPTEILRFYLVAAIAGFFFPLLIPISVLIFLFGIFSFLALSQRIFWFGLGAACCLMAGYSQFRAHFDLRNDTLPDYISLEGAWEGEIVSFPDTREKTNRAYVDLDSFRSSDSEEVSIRGKALLITGAENIFDYGDRVRIEGKLLAARDFGTFNYRAYLRRFGAHGILKSTELEILKPAIGGSFLLRTAKKTRNILAQNLSKSLPEPHATIAMGVLLGVKNQMPDHTAKDFKQSGLQHLLVVSGTNVTIVIMAIGFLFQGLGRRGVFVFSMLALVFFVSMVGFDPPVIRSAFMGSLVAFAAIGGRTIDIRNVVLLSAVMIGLVSPSVVKSDVGFFLSFGATLGIVLLVPVFLHEGPRRFDFLKHKWAMALYTILSVSLAAQIFVLPVLAFYFEQFPVIGLIANILVEPLVPFAMFFSFVSTILGVLPIFFARLFGLPAFVVLEILLQVAHIFGQIVPIEVGKLTGIVSTFLIGIFSLWGLFSVRFENRYLVKTAENEELCDSA